MTQDLGVISKVALSVLFLKYCERSYHFFSKRNLVNNKFTNNKFVKNNEPKKEQVIVKKDSLEKESSPISGSPILTDPVEENMKIFGVDLPFTHPQLKSTVDCIVYSPEAILLLLAVAHETGKVLRSKIKGEELNIDFNSLNTTTDSFLDTVELKTGLNIKMYLNLLKSKETTVPTKETASEENTATVEDDAEARTRHLYKLMKGY